MSTSIFGEKKFQRIFKIGEHKIEIKAADQFGKTYTETSSYRLENQK